MGLGFKGCFSMDCMGNSDGLILSWNNRVSISVKSFSVGHIDSVVSDGMRFWRFTRFYGNPRVAE